eukprot:7692837-Lingulodinium_polyedra.AAC.1
MAAARPGAYACYTPRILGTPECHAGTVILAPPHAEMGFWASRTPTNAGKLINRRRTIVN